MAAAPPIALSVVVPAFNEEQNVAPVVREIVETIAREDWIDGYEIVLVDDGSRDGTAGVMARLATEFAQVRVVRHELNRGFGAALKTGFAASRGAFVTCVTADGEVGVDQPLRLLREMGDRDLMLSGRARTVGAGRSVLTWGLSWASRLLMGFWPDESVGSYVVRRDILRTIPLRSDTGLVNLEVLLYCKSHHCRIGRSGVTQARPRLSGESKVTNLPTIWRTLLEMWKLRWHIRREYTVQGPR